MRKILPGLLLVLLASTSRGQTMLAKATPNDAATESSTRTTIMAVQKTISGKVTDQSTGEGLPGVSIVAKSTSNGTTTDANGNYRLTVADNVTTLVFSFVGFERVEEEINNRSVIDLSLAPDIQALSEVVVVGYGTQEARDVTGAVAMITSKEIETLPLTTTDQALQGRVPGVQVTQASSAPGGGVTIRIRGGNSMIGGNEPLFVIDGFPISQSNAPNPTGRGFNENLQDPANPLAALNPNDIESITILKDASATAIYGARGANGVVLITTKRGKAGKTNVTLDSYYGVQQVARQYPVMNRDEFIAFANENAVNAKQKLPYPDPVSSYPDINWQDEVFRTAPMQSHQLGLSGGDEKTRFSLSGNYFNQQGIVKKSGLTRYSLRLNLDRNVGKRLTVGNSLLISRSNNDRALAGGGQNTDAGVLLATLWMPPTLPIFKEDGTYNNGLDSRLTSQLGHDNPLQFVNDMSDNLINERVLGNVYAQYDLTDKIKLRVSGGADLENQDRKMYFGSTTLKGAGGGQGVISGNKRLSLLNENTLTYDNTFGKLHDLNVVVGYTVQQETYETTSMWARGFPSDRQGVDNIGAATQVGSISSDKSQWRLNSWLGRINYKFDNRYLLTVSARADGSSRFGKSNRWGFFPSAALAWRVSDEAFMSSLPAISDLKLRVSVGVTGNSEIDAYPALARLQQANYPYDDQLENGVRPVQVANPDLKWESTRQLNLGADWGFFKDRLTFSYNYYYKTTYDLLLPVDLPKITGFSTAILNSGSIRNKGMEFAVGGRPLVGNFKWDLNGFVSFNRSEILSLGESTPFFVQEIGGGQVSNYGKDTGPFLDVGLPVGTFFTWHALGIFKTQEEILAHGAQVKDGAVPGDIKVFDKNGDGKIDNQDKQVVGNPEPDFIFGMTNNFQYRSFDLSVFVQGSYGNDIMNMNSNFLEFGAVTFANASKRMLNRWSPANPDGLYQGAVGKPTRVYQRYTDLQFVEDGSYLRVKNITLGYRLPANKVANLDRLRVYASVQNAFTFTNYQGFNPDVNARGQNTLLRGIDLGTYPLARIYTLGLNISL